VVRVKNEITDVPAFAKATAGKPIYNKDYTGTFGAW
jgi:hypothetical protein